MILGRISKAEEAHRRARALRWSLLDLDDRLDGDDYEAAGRVASGIFEAARSLETIVKALEGRALERRAQEPKR